MPDEDGSKNIEEKPPDKPFSQLPIQAVGNQNPPPPPTTNPPDSNADYGGQLRKIEHGERWLIGIGIFGVLVNVWIALIYSGQLNEMRKATEATTKALQLTRDSFETSDGDFQRTMNQIIAQTAAQLKSAHAAEEQSMISNRTAKSAENALHITESPDIHILGLECSTFPQVLSPETAVRFVYRNLGRGSATEVSNYAYLGIYGGNIEQQPPSGKSVLGPSGDISIGPLIVRNTGIDNATIGLINTGQIVLHLWGWISYRDRFGIHHLLVHDARYIPNTACDFKVVGAVAIP